MDSALALAQVRLLYTLVKPWGSEYERYLSSDWFQFTIPWLEMRVEVYFWFTRARNFPPTFRFENSAASSIHCTAQTANIHRLYTTQSLYAQLYTAKSLYVRSASATGLYQRTSKHEESSTIACDRFEFWYFRSFFCHLSGRASSYVNKNWRLVILTVIYCTIKSYST